MDELDQLEQQIKQRLATARDRRNESQDLMRRQMQEHERRMAQFHAAAKRLVAVIIRPRLARLASLFENAHLAAESADAPNRCTCHFNRTVEYPATTTLDVNVAPDSDASHGLVTYDLEILPVFFPFVKHDQLVVSLGAVDEAGVASWLEARLLDFTDTYLKIQDAEPYQQENFVVDPVCGMRVNRANAAATAEFEGVTYYFCIEDCRDRFVREPRRYVAKRS